MNQAIIIGCGITGAFTALELAKSSILTTLLESSPEPSFGTTSANSGIVHASHNTQPNTIKFSLTDPGNREIKKLSKILNFGFLQCGEVVVAHDESQMPALLEMEKLAKSQNLTVKLLNQQELHQKEPNVVGFAGLFVAEAAVVNPYEMCQSVWNTAAKNGVLGRFGEKVIGIEKVGGLWAVTTDKGCYKAQYIVNCAGLHSGEISKMALKEKNRVVIQARKGEEYILEKGLKGIVKSIIFPLPNGSSKGTLVIPTVDGTIMVGPTAVECEDLENKATSAEGMQKVFSEARKLVPSINEGSIIAQFTGLRAADQSGDFIVENVDNFINLAGIQSPGLTAAPMLGKMGADFITKERSKPLVYAPLHTKLMNGDKQKLIKEDGNHSKIVCGCECVSLADVHNAITDGARTVDGIKTRTRAGMGPCQAGFCTGVLVDILSQRLGVNKNSICKNNEGSNIIANQIDSPVNHQEIEDIIPYTPAKLENIPILVKSHKQLEVTQKIKTNPTFDVIILGAGPAGLAAAEAAGYAGKSVLILEKSNRTGGVLIQCNHSGFGIQKYGKDLTGPEYAELLEQDCLAANASLLMHSFITGCAKTDDGFTISTITRGLGVIAFKAKTLISCMGSRERSRAGIKLQGTRPAGIYTAGLAQQMINLQGQLPGKKVVILGTDSVGLSIARRLTLEGAEVIAIYEPSTAPISPQTKLQECVLDFKIPLHLSKTIVNVHGNSRLNSVDVAPVNPSTNTPDMSKIETINCDCLLLSAGLIPQAKVSLALGGKPGFFSAGNCSKIHQMADLAAEQGWQAGCEAVVFLGGKASVCDVKAGVHEDVLTTSVKLEGAEFGRLPVRLSKGVEKGMQVEAAKQMRQFVVSAPVRLGDVVGSVFGADVVACCSAEKK